MIARRDLRVFMAGACAGLGLATAVLIGTTELNSWKRPVFRTPVVPPMIIPRGMVSADEFSCARDIDRATRYAWTDLEIDGRRVEDEWTWTIMLSPMPGRGGAFGGPYFECRVTAFGEVLSLREIPEW